MAALMSKVFSVHMPSPSVSLFLIVLFLLRQPALVSSDSLTVIPPSGTASHAPPQAAPPATPLPPPATPLAPQPYKILLVTVQLGSHVIEKMALGETLLARGHDVYIAVSTTYPKRAALERVGLKPVLYSMPADLIVGGSEAFERMAAEEIFKPTSSFREMGKRTSTMTLRDCSYMMHDLDFLNRVRSLKFDLAIAEPFILSPCTLVLPEHLRIPFITLGAFYLPWEIRQPSLPSFVALGAPLTRESVELGSILTRVLNALKFFGIHQLGWVLPGLKDTKILELYAPWVTSWGELIRRSRLFLVETDWRLGGHAPMMDNMVSVAGLTAFPARPLPEELDGVVRAAGDSGVVVVSFGSAAYYIPARIVAVFFAAFSRLDQTVIARFAAPDGVEIPRNVRLVPWLPQNDLLGHRNTRLFITHCGNNGQHEALYHGVPMIGFPLFAEQKQNCIRAADKGFGLHMDITDFTADQLVQNINEVLENSKYREKIKMAADMWREDLTTPRQRAAHAVEHVIKYGGRHLRSPAMDMPLWQFLMMDVLAVLLGAVTLCAVLIRWALGKLWRACRGRGKKGAVKNSSKKDE